MDVCDEGGGGLHPGAIVATKLLVIYVRSLRSR
jgi:hypothetical protein